MARKTIFYLVVLASLFLLVMCKNEANEVQSDRAPAGFTDTPAPTATSVAQITNTPRPTATSTLEIHPTDDTRPTTYPPQRTPLPTATKKKQSSNSNPATATPIPTLVPVAIPDAGIGPGPEGIIKIVAGLVLAVSLFVAGWDLLRRGFKEE
ncbi:MAG: hypothetical protein JXA42_26105 [Anaerolineales bacterium]|nr:hypothetical protein [Anaerolineales bacterium]